MKGKLYKKTEGWMVFYVEKNSAYTSTSYQKSLPLHPEDNPNYEFGRDMEGKEVDFEIVNESWDGYKGCTYAKLINHIADISNMVELSKQKTQYTEEEMIGFTEWKDYINSLKQPKTMKVYYLKYEDENFDNYPDDITRIKFTVESMDIADHLIEKFKEQFKNIDVPKESEVMDFLKRNK